MTTVVDSRMSLDGLVSHRLWELHWFNELYWTQVPFKGLFVAENIMTVLSTQLDVYLNVSTEGHAEPLLNFSDSVKRRMETLEK